MEKLGKMRILSRKKTVVIVGASNNRDKFGNKAVRAFLDKGFRVIPVNHKEEFIEGIRCYKTIKEAKEYCDISCNDIDILNIYVPPRVTRDLLPEIIDCNCDLVILNPGSSDGDVLNKLFSSKKRYQTVCSIRYIDKSPYEYR